MPIYPMPFCRVEIALQSVAEGRLSTLFVRREESPHKDRWGLPGGVVRVDLDSDLDAAARRVATERLGVTPPNLRQLCAVGAQGRDPRGGNSWGLSIVFWSLTPLDLLRLTPGKRVKGLKWIGADEVSHADQFAFDHREIAERAMRATRSDIAALRFPPGFVPDRFTLSQLQALCEQVLGARLDKSSFRRKLAERELVTPIEGEFTSGLKNRPAAIYRLLRHASEGCAQG